MKLNVFGKKIEVARKENQWKVFYFGNEGKKRAAEDIVLPAGLKEEEIVAYIADLCHEWATPNHNEAKKID